MALFHSAPHELLVLSCGVVSSLGIHRSFSLVDGISFNTLANVQLVDQPLPEYLEIVVEPR